MLSDAGSVGMLPVFCRSPGTSAIPCAIAVFGVIAATSRRSPSTTSVPFSAGMAPKIA